jgi:hypothetical protein
MTTICCERVILFWAGLVLFFSLNAEGAFKIVWNVPLDEALELGVP